ncbi:MAG: hypothetical protein FJ146_09780 [Deltaproteobacteria bacterium]|nr:hypothetical protein [Deltaproteobacteria bacterium]
MAVFDHKTIWVMLAAASLGQMGCKAHGKRTTGEALQPTSYSVQAAVGNGLDNKIDSRLVWQRNELPKCLQNRVDAKFYVWAEQKTLSCRASGAWE